MSVAIGKMSKSRAGNGTMGVTGFAGNTTFKVISRNEKAPLGWKVRNNTRPAYISGWLAKHVAGVVSKFLPITTITSELEIRKLDYARGMWVDYGVVGRKVVTTLGAEIICDGFQGGSAAISDFRYHALGAESGAETVGDLILESEWTTGYLSDGSRAEGTQTEQAASPQVYETVATNTTGAGSGADEHGIFNQEGGGTGSLLDRTVFAVITLSASDAIQSTYRLTVQAGG